MSHSAPSLGVQDALDDIDMELLQDTVQRDDLGQSVQNVRRFQTDARKEAFDTGGKPDYREIAKRQFQINDMLLALLQELATRERALELELRMPQTGSTARPMTPSAAGAGEDEAARPSSEDLVRQLDAIQSVMHDDALRLQLELTPNDTPVVGRLVGSMRAAVHSLVVFYGNQLAAKQTEINRVYGDVLHQLLLARAQDHAELAALRALLPPQGGGGEEAKES